MKFHNIGKVIFSIALITPEPGISERLPEAVFYTKYIYQKNEIVHQLSYRKGYV